MTSECIVCLEPLGVRDVLSCNHCVHKKCVKMAVDIIQQDLMDNGYPRQYYGKCPICRAVQYDIPSTPSMWVGQMTLSKQQILLLINLLQDNGGFIDRGQVPSFIKDALINACPDEHILFTNRVASALWLAHYSDIPETVKISQKRGGVFSMRTGKGAR